MNIVVSEELQAYIDPLTPEEHDALERSILAEGCRDALVLWGDLLIDGHNRHAICQKHGLPFRTLQHPHMRSMEDVHLWMIDQHLGRRSVSDFQRGVLALRKKDILAQRLARPRQEDTSAPASPEETPPRPDDSPVVSPPSADTVGREPVALKSRADIAKAARLSSSQVVMIEKIQKQAAPEVVAAVKAGTISLNAAAAVATLPIEEQQAAAQAGKEELRQAARRVRDVKRKPVQTDDAGDNELQRLRHQVEVLTAENAALRAQLAELQRAAQG
jgi:hypothetical protein